MAARKNKVSEKGTPSEQRLVTHIDTDGIVSAVIMSAVNLNKYKDVSYTDYSVINKGGFIFVATDDVVDLPQPRNPMFDDIGDLVRNESGIVFEDIVTNFWADHHETGKRGSYNGNYVFDAKSKSCASLLYRHFLPSVPSLERFHDLIAGTDVVDSAGYLTPEAPYDTKNPAVVLRLMLTSRSLKKTEEGFRERLIQQCADPKQDWHDAIYLPVVIAMADESIAEYGKYRQYIKPQITCEHGVVIKAEEEKRPYGNGIKDRYYPFMLYPDSLFLLDVARNYVGSGYLVSMSENMFVKYKSGNHPSQLLLGESMRKIVKTILGTTDAGGHKGIGVCSSAPADKKDEVVNACKELLFGEATRLGY